MIEVSKWKPKYRVLTEWIIPTASITSTGILKYARISMQELQQLTEHSSVHRNPIHEIKFTTFGNWTGNLITTCNLWFHHNLRSKYSWRLHQQRDRNGRYYRWHNKKKSHLWNQTLRKLLRLLNQFILSRSSSWVESGASVYQNFNKRVRSFAGAVSAKPNSMMSSSSND